MRILLNIVKRENFVFFDPINKIHLNRVNPIGEVSILSNELKRAIISGNVIDIDNGFNIEISDKVKNVNESLLKSLNIKPKIKEEVKVEEIKEVIEEDKITEKEIEEEVKELKKRKIKSKDVK